MAIYEDLVSKARLKTFLDEIKKHFPVSVNGKKQDSNGNIVIPNFGGASASSNGTSGMVPAPLKGQQDKVLKGDGTWDIVSIAGGGTGAITAADARENLGLGNVAVENILPITKGGTGADNAKVARKNLGLATVASSGDYNDLSNKPSIPLKPKAYIVETYRNGTEWYRVWSDGWLEQWGQVVKVTDGNITFLKAFKYIPTIVTSVSKAYNVTLGGFVVNQSVSTTNFSFKTAIWGSNGIIFSGYSADFTWYACGQGA